MTTYLRILLVEDSEDDASLLLREVRRGGYEIEFERVETAGAMRAALARQQWDLIICDFSLPSFSAPNALGVLKESDIDLPFIIVSGTIEEESAVDALKAGAHDFITKGNFARLLPAIERERKEAAVRRERREHERELEAIALVSSQLRTAKTFNDMLSRLLDQAVSLVQAEAASIWLYDPVQDVIELKIQRGWSDEYIGSFFKPGEGIPGIVVQQGKAIVAREFHQDEHVPQENRPIPPGVGGACIPLHSEDNIVGALLIHVTLPRELTRGELRILNALAEIGGNSIHRMVLYEQTVKQLEKLAALRSIDLAISSVFDLRVTLTIVLNEVIRQLKVDAACVLLLQSASNRLEYVEGQGFQTRNIETTSLRVGEGSAGQAFMERQLVQVPNLATDRIFTRGQLLADERFVSYYAVPLVSKGEVKGVLEVFHRARLNPDQEWLDFLEILGGQTAIAVENSMLFQDLQRSNFELMMAYDATIEGWSRALDLRDRETEGHTQRVTEMTLRLASKMGLNEERLTLIKRGALLHDIGKMGIPDYILLKPESLTEEEQRIMRQHPQLAYDMLEPIVYLRDALNIPYCHHEKWDGSGYPRGLAGTQIPLEARLFAIVDVWDAITADRPYRKGWPRPQALNYIREQSGKYFDPKLVELFLQEMEDQN
ncbi:MAG TPA: HD domain-containing phosphohydrolase [Anaerolineales bacterium]|jgi:putative nucleotidyltransferase with HDIG domain|nr:HD domain-containing phosphohydrolase [Anaerolineales bacterium]